MQQSDDTQRVSGPSLWGFVLSILIGWQSFAANQSAQIKGSIIYADNYRIGLLSDFFDSITMELLVREDEQLYCRNSQTCVA